MYVYVYVCIAYEVIRCRYTMWKRIGVLVSPIKPCRCSFVWSTSFNSCQPWGESWKLIIPREEGGGRRRD